LAKRSKKKSAEDDMSSWDPLSKVEPRDAVVRLLKNRIIFLYDEITEDVAITLIAQLLLLDSENKEDQVSMYIMSPGGDITPSLAIYDTMQHVSCPVATYCLGEAASCGAFLLAAGEPGKRFALPSSRIMIHQPWGEVFGDNESIRIQTKEMTKLRDMMYDRLSKHTGKPKKDIAKDCDRDFWMGATEARKYGLIDHVVSPSKRRKR
jgi:ATP-dependent Clp protease protease subunit